MPSFSQYIKNNVKLELVSEDKFDISLICAQFNPDRFKHWRKVSDKRDYLGLEYSPHVHFLRAYDRGERVLENAPFYHYYQMHALYGKKPKWIMKKIAGFLKLYEIIKDGQRVDLPSILDKPLCPNGFNRDRMEIYEGHHRITAYYAAGYDIVECELYNVEYLK